jgi:hypothetical protein
MAVHPTVPQRQNTETIADASKVVGLEVNTEKTSYVVVSSPKYRQNNDTKVVNEFFKNVAQFRYLGMTVINQSLIQEEIKRRLHSSNVCYHSVKNLLSSYLLSNNLKITNLQTCKNKVKLLTDYESVTQKGLLCS